jgi:hypothetical protein
MSNLKYRTFEQLLSDVAVDLPKFNQEGAIKTAQLIKVALRLNYDLGLKIHQEKETVLEVERGRVRLPDDLYLLNYGNVCISYTTTQPVIHGSHTEDVILDCAEPSEFGDFDGQPFCPGRCSTSRCGQLMYVKQTFKSETRFHTEFANLKIKVSKEVPNSCPNTKVNSGLEAYIKHGFLYTNFENGTVFINYLGNMQDEEGNLLVPDHPLLNEYYEYAVKQRILENMAMDGENVQAPMQIVEMRLRPARNNALSFVNTPDFADLKKIWEMNRKAMHNRFYSSF